MLFVIAFIMEVVAVNRYVVHVQGRRKQNLTSTAGHT